MDLFQGTNLLPVSRKKFLLLLGGSLALVYPFVGGALHPKWQNQEQRPERTIIVTGATGTLGASTTYHLALRKCRVIMACRDMEKCRSVRRELVLLTKNKSIVCRHLDLEDIDSITRFCDEMTETEPHIDVLINNAAIKSVGKREETKYGIEKLFFVNFLAPYMLTLKLLNKLKESARITNDSRIINVIGSPTKSWSIDLNDINFTKRRYIDKLAYNQSKLALAYFSILLEKRNRIERNQVYVFGTSPSTNRILPDFRHETGLLAEFKTFIDEYSHDNATNVCQRTVMCALDRSMVREEHNGKLYNWFLTSFGRMKGWGIAAMNEEKAKLVWNVAADMLMNAKEKPVMPDKSPEQAPAVRDGGVSRGGDQVKVQGNNKASGVDESA